MLIPHVSRMAGTASLECTECGTYVIDFDATAGDSHDGCPKAVSHTLNLDLTVEVCNDGNTLCTLTEAGGFDAPLAESTGATPREAMVALIDMIDLPMPDARDVIRQAFAR